MGWGGYGMYDGDGTQTCHYDFIRWAKISRSNEEIGEWLKYRGTKIPKDKVHLLTEHVDLILKKMPKVAYWNEDKAITWQMLLCLYLDNGVVPPSAQITDLGVQATKYLMGDHADEFSEPSRRRRALRNFLKRVESKTGFNVEHETKPYLISV